MPFPYSMIPSSTFVPGPFNCSLKTKILPELYAQNLQRWPNRNALPSSDSIWPVPSSVCLTISVGMFWNPYLNSRKIKKIITFPACFGWLWSPWLLNIQKKHCSWLPVLRFRAYRSSRPADYWVGKRLISLINRSPQNRTLPVGKNWFKKPPRNSPLMVQEKVEWFTLIASVIRLLSELILYGKEYHPF